MPRRRVNSSLNKKRKKITPNSVAETKFLIALKKELKKQLKLPENPSIDDAIKAVKKINLNKLKRLSYKLGVDILKKNRKGFEGILNALAAGYATQKQINYKKKEQELFNAALPSLIKEEHIYKPFISKFEENLALIKDIPEDVANSLKTAYLKGGGFRGTSIENYLIDRLGKRARLIIRTESSKLNAALTEVRATSLGISGYIWSTGLDERVRPSHKMMEGVLVFYTDKPKLDNMEGHAGEFPNCRCVGLPVFDIDDLHFPVKVAEKVVIESKYDKKTKTSKAYIKSGAIKSYDKKEFLDKYGKKL